MTTEKSVPLLEFGMKQSCTRSGKEQTLNVYVCVPTLIFTYLYKYTRGLKFIKNIGYLLIPFSCENFQVLACVLPQTQKGTEEHQTVNPI